MGATRLIIPFLRRCRGEQSLLRRLPAGRPPPGRGLSRQASGHPVANGWVMRSSLLNLPALTVFAGILLAAPLWSAPDSAEEGQHGSWQPAGSLTVGRYAPGAAALPDGRVLVAGGFSFESGRTHASSELFTPATGTWEAGPSLRWDRNFPSVFPLPDGDTLFVGGFRAHAGTTATVERLQAGRLRFRLDEPAVEERELCSVTSLRDGRVLLAGGYSTVQRKTLDTAELYDPQSGRFTAVGGLRHARFGHAGILLPDGRVLIVGGKVEATNADVLPAELFDPATRAFRETAALHVGRDRCTGWLIHGGRVLVAGGSARDGGTVPARRCEIYDASAGAFVPGPELVRDRMAHTATLLPGGRVLLAGGWSGSESRTTPQAELWDPKLARFLPAGQQQLGRHDPIAVLLKDGRVLVAGGKQAPARGGVESPLDAEIWCPEP